MYCKHAISAEAQATLFCLPIAAPHQNHHYKNRIHEQRTKRSKCHLSSSTLSSTTGGTVIILLLITFNRSVTDLVSFCHNHSFPETFRKKMTHTLLFCTPRDDMHSVPAGKPVLSVHRLSACSQPWGFIYTALVFLPSAHHIGGKVWKSTEQSRACLSPTANMKPVLAPSRQSLHQQLVSSLWGLKTAKDLLVSKKEFKQS